MKLNGKMINNINYADDCVVMAENLCDLQQIMNKIVEYSNRYGLYINITKTKTMFQKPHNRGLFTKGQNIAQVSKFT